MDKSGALSMDTGILDNSGKTLRERERLAAVYESLKKPVFMLALSILRDHALAEDIMQQTFVNVMEHANSFHKGTNEKAWVMSITHNLAINLLKKRGHEEPGLDQFFENERGMETDMTGSADFTRALSELDEAERAIVTLKAVCGFHHAQIAKAVGVSVTDSRAKYSRALKKLKKYYLENSGVKG